MGGKQFCCKWISILLFVCSIILVVPLESKAAVGGVQIVGDDCGLVIEAIDAKEDTSNLNPGDLKWSSLKLINKGEKPLRASLKTIIIAGSESSPKGGRLAEYLTLTIKQGSDLILDGLIFKEAAELPYSDLGLMDAGEEIVLDFLVNLSADAGNSFQGATFQVKWLFMTRCSDNGGNNGNNGNNDKDNGNGNGSNNGDNGHNNTGNSANDSPQKQQPQPGEQSECVATDCDQVSPREPAAEESTVAEEDPMDWEDNLPADFVALPHTGEASRLYLYGIGLMVIALGIILKK